MSGETIESRNHGNSSGSHSVERVNGDVTSTTDQSSGESTSFKKTSNSSSEQSHTVTSSSNSTSTTPSGGSSTETSTNHFSDVSIGNYSYSQPGSSGRGESRTSYTRDQSDGGAAQETYSSSGSSTSSYSTSKDDGATHVHESGSRTGSYDLSKTSATGGWNGTQSSGSNYDRTRSYQITTNTSSSASGETSRGSKRIDFDSEEGSSTSVSYTISNGTWTLDDESYATSFAGSTFESSFTTGGTYAHSSTDGAVHGAVQYDGSTSQESHTSSESELSSSGVWQQTDSTSRSASGEHTRQSFSESGNRKYGGYNLDPDHPISGTFQNHSESSSDVTSETSSSGSGSGYTQSGTSMSAASGTTSYSFNGQGTVWEACSTGVTTGPLNVHTEHGASWGYAHYRSLGSDGFWHDNYSESESAGSGNGGYGYEGNGHAHVWSYEDNGWRGVDITVSASGGFAYGYSSSDTDSSGSSSSSGSGSYTYHDDFGFTLSGAIDDSRSRNIQDSQTAQFVNGHWELTDSSHERTGDPNPGYLGFGGSIENMSLNVGLSNVYGMPSLPWPAPSMLMRTSGTSQVSSEESAAASLGSSESLASSMALSSQPALISLTASTFSTSSAADAVCSAASASSAVPAAPAAHRSFTPASAIDSLLASFARPSADEVISAVRSKLGARAVATPMSSEAVDALFHAGNGSLDEANATSGSHALRSVDSAGRLAGMTDLNGGTTRFTYDAAGNLASLTDAVGNTTSWAYEQSPPGTDGTLVAGEGHGEGGYRVASETDVLGASRTFDYDSSGNLARTTDRDGRVRVYQYDSAGNVASETWYATAEDAEGAENTQNTIVYQRDSAGRITSESDAVSSVAYVYDSTGRIASTTQSSVGGPTVVLAYQYDSAGRRTQMAATIDGTADFVDDYVYDSLGRVVSVTEHGVTGGNAVADKTIDFTYNDAGQIVSIERYEGTELVVTADYAYDSSGRLTGLLYHQGTTVLNSYAWTYIGTSADATPIPNPQSLIPSPWLPTGGLMPIHDTSGVTSALASGGLAGLDLLTGVTSSDDTAAYTYDATGQLTGVTYSAANPQSPIPNPSESYSYDANGNRTGSGYVVGTGNRLLSDGTYTYSYDAEGNRTARFIDVDESGTLTAGDTQLTEYTWDARNRLVEVAERAAVGGAATQVVDYLYDVEDRWIGENIDSNGDGQIDHQIRFVYDGNQIVAQFDKDGAGSVTAADESHRYLWGPAVDQLLADERTHLDGSGNIATQEVLWPLTDNLGTVRDLARMDGTTTSVVDHIIYSAFGGVTSESNPAEGSLFKFTARATDNTTGIEFHDERVKIAGSADWMSEDPIGFTAGDTNTRRYCENSPTNLTDPSGLAALTPAQEGYIARAKEILEAAHLSNAEVRLRLAIIKAVFSSVVVGIGDVRNPEYWEERGDDGPFIPKHGKFPTDAIKDIWHFPGGRVYCQKYSALILIKGYIDLAEEAKAAGHASGARVLGALNTLFMGKQIPNELPHAGEGIFFTRLTKNTGPGFAPSELLPGDQVWFKNPYYHSMSPTTPGGDPPSAGEEGSNVFYIGDGMVVSIYSKQVKSIAQYQAGMMGWSTVTDTAWLSARSLHPTASDFQIRAVRRPLDPARFYHNITQ